MAEKTKQGTSLGILGVIGLFLLGKAKWLFALLKIGKLTTLISMFVTVGAYALVYGWKFAVVLVYLLFIHEMGHLVAMKYKKIPASPAIFIPFLGAAISMKKPPKNARDEAFIAYGGPLFGLLSFLPAVYLYHVNGDPFWGMVIFIGAFLNLFNLFPISPLDGGRIVGLLSPKLWLLGLAGLLAYVVISPSPILILILLFGFFNWWERFREEFHLQKTEQQHALFAIEQEEAQMWMRELQEYRGQTNFIYILDQYIDQASREQETLQRQMANKGWLPFVNDHHKLQDAERKQKIDLLQMRKQYLLVPLKLYVERGEEEGDLFHHYESVLEEKKQELAETLSHRKHYYVASKKTKLIVLVLYVALAAVLSYFTLYGHDLMEQHKDSISSIRSQ
ncbi:peptidase M50 [Fictibacillus macauensis ZFHKF-1]|uniref:Peptidase M50 n=1 Tax=Fictibacillus macauensis ZFHKF-1 TaxID=1196324 RepID=I8UJH2_9BACL|nr:site-2 protease family protein [Fictibacillus macauensis]EIT86958.1 peptidase M50 [Fictibacillus macauensis ZFHKF-1]